MTQNTPTDDERQALAEIIDKAPATPALGQKAVDFWGDVADAVLAAGFRRSEAPEPSAEEWAERISAAREKAIAKGYTPEHDAKHGIRHLLRWAIDYARRGKAGDSSGLIAAAIDLADVAYAELERLRHVADTTRAVSEALRTRYASDSQAAYFMRQIDAALEAVPEPQGEPSDAHDDDCEAEYVVGAASYTDCDCRERAAEQEHRKAVTAGAAAISAILDDREVPWNPEVLADAALRAAGGAR